MDANLYQSEEEDPAWENPDVEDIPD